MKYKKMDLVIEAFNEMKLPLKIVGRGMEKEYLSEIAGPTVEFMGRVSDEELRDIYAKAQAFIFPQEEDFGIVAIEALASGRPLIAFKGGDVVEHIQEGKTGVFFKQQTKKKVIAAVRKFQSIDFDGEFIRSTSLKFEKENFQKKIKDFIESKREDFVKEKEFVNNKNIK